MWDCKPCATPLDAKSRLSNKDCPQVVDQALHRRYCSITGCLSYLVNMTRPNLSFAYSQLSKFVQYPGVDICKLPSGYCHMYAVLMIREFAIMRRRYFLEMVSTRRCCLQ
jgi:hypothetical protein